MLTQIDKALQDFVVSAIAIAAFFGFDFSKWENIAVTVAGALGKAIVTWWVPNKPAA
jgi:hypothetical protein